MRIVVAPQELKGSLTATAAAAAMAAGLRRALPAADLDLAPVADGGPGTVDALVSATGGTLVTAAAHDALGRPLTARYALLPGGETAVIESAAAAGLVLLRDEERDASVADSAGVGELMRNALDRGCERIIVGLGGTATNDGGAGMARALGVRMTDASGQELPPGGLALARLHRIDISGLDPRISKVTVIGATDVRNPLCGPDGASAVFGPQKGATPEQVALLDGALAHYATLLARITGRAIADLPGAGAAGGLGAGLIAFCHAELSSGFDLVAEAIRLEDRLARADLVITGEGRLDGQSRFGKTTTSVGRLAARHGVPVVALCGSLGDGWESALDYGITAAWSIFDGPAGLADAMSGAARLVEQAAWQVGRLAAALATSPRIAQNSQRT